MYASGTDQTGTENKTLDKGTRRGHNYNDTEKKPALSADKHTLSNKHGICQFCVPGFSLPCENNLNMWAWQAIHTSSPDCCLLGRQTRNLPVLCSMVHVAMGICLGLAIFAFHALCPLPWQFLSPQTNNEFVCFVFQVLVVRNKFLSLAALFFSVLSFDGSIPRQWSSEFVSFAFREFLLRMNIKTTRLAETRSRQGTRKFYNV